jgi:hypothetical protein
MKHGAVECCVFRRRVPAVSQRCMLVLPHSLAPCIAPTGQLPNVCPLRLLENKRDKTTVDGMQLSKLFQAAILAQFVPETVLRQLQISVPLPRHASGLLSEALPVANSLTSLSFRGSLIGDDHMALIIPGLRNAPQITCLDVAGCRLTEPSALALADLVRSRVIRYDESCLLPTKRVSDGWMRQFGRENERKGKDVKEMERKGTVLQGVSNSYLLPTCNFLVLLLCRLQSITRAGQNRNGSNCHCGRILTVAWCLSCDSGCINNGCSACMNN